MTKIYIKTAKRAVKRLNATDRATLCLITRKIETTSKSYINIQNNSKNLSCSTLDSDMQHVIESNRLMCLAYPRFGSNFDPATTAIDLFGEDNNNE